MTIQIISIGSLRKEGIKWHHAVTLRSLAWYAFLTKGEAKWSAMVNLDAEGVRPCFIDYRVIKNL